MVKTDKGNLEGSPWRFLPLFFHSFCFLFVLLHRLLYFTSIPFLFYFSHLSQCTQGTNKITDLSLKSASPTNKTVSHYYLISESMTIT